MVNFLSELEIHKIVPIRSQSREDFEAIKLLNLMHMMSLLDEGMVQREHDKNYRPNINVLLYFTSVS